MGATSDILYVNGINSMGYGQVARIVMLDSRLSVKAKGLYAYFCSFTGSGNNYAFPKRETIISDLKITKELFAKCCKELTESGYLTVVQERSSTNQFRHNVYTIEKYPDRLQSGGEGETFTDALAKVVIGHDISLGGYGNAPKMIMADTGVSLSAKGLYAFLASYAGSSITALPVRTEIQTLLGISDKTFKTLSTELESRGYIARKWINCDVPGYRYYPCREESRKKQDTGNRKNTDTENRKKQETGIRKKADTESRNNPDTGNRKKQDINNTSEQNNKTTHISRSVREDGMADINDILNHICDYGLTGELFTTEETVLSLLKRLSHYEKRHAAKSFSEEEAYRFEVYKISLYVLAGKLMSGSREVLADKLSDWVSVTRGSDGSITIGPETDELFDAVFSKFRKEAESKEIRNPQKYIESVTDTILVSGKLERFIHTGNKSGQVRELKRPGSVRKTG